MTRDVSTLPLSLGAGAFCVHPNSALVSIVDSVWLAPNWELCKSYKLTFSCLDETRARMKSNNQTNHTPRSVVQACGVDAGSSAAARRLFQMCSPCAPSPSGAHGKAHVWGAAWRPVGWTVTWRASSHRNHKTIILPIKKGWFVLAWRERVRLITCNTTHERVRGTDALAHKSPPHF